MSKEKKDLILNDLTGFRVEKVRGKKISSKEEEKEFKREFNKEFLKTRVKDVCRNTEKGISIDLDINQLSIEDIESLYTTEKGNYTIAYFKHTVGLFTIQGTCIVRKKELALYKEHLANIDKMKKEKEALENKRQLELILSKAKEQGIDINTLLG